MLYLEIFWIDEKQAEFCFMDDRLYQNIYRWNKPIFMNSMLLFKSSRKLAYEKVILNLADDLLWD